MSAAGDVRLPKALLAVAGRTLLQRSVDALAAYVDVIVVALPIGLTDPPPLDCGAAAVLFVEGGSTRQQSVARALTALTALKDDARSSRSVDWVLVHDAARALVPPDVVRRVLAALRAGASCVVPTIAPADSLRQIGRDGRNAPLARSTVRLVQTPQGFTLDSLRRGHLLAADQAATDDASLVEATGETVTLVEGDPRAFKITHPLDLALASALLSAD